MTVIGVIPARGGSKRLPRKNIVEFHGKPIIAWTIEAAYAVGVLDRVIVSTEDREIAETAKRFGAEVVARPDELASDAAMVRDVCLDLIAREEEAGRRYDILCCLYATAPLRRAEDIRRVVSLVRDEGADFALAASEYLQPPHQALRLDADGSVVPFLPALVDKRASEIGRLVVDNGSTYATRIDAFRRTGSFYGTPMRVHVMPRERSIDIDDAADLELARFHAPGVLE